MTHPADIGIMMDNHGPYRAMILAASRGDLEGYKLALQQSFGPAAKRVYEKTVDKIYEYALKEVEKLMDATAEADEKSLVFWATIADNHEKRCDLV